MSGVKRKGVLWTGIAAVLFCLRTPQALAGFAPTGLPARVGLRPVLAIQGARAFAAFPIAPRAYSTEARVPVLSLPAAAALAPRAALGSVASLFRETPGAFAGRPLLLGLAGSLGSEFSLGRLFDQDSREGANPEPAPLAGEELLAPLSEFIAKEENGKPSNVRLDETASRFSPGKREGSIRVALGTWVQDTFVEIEMDLPQSVMSRRGDAVYFSFSGALYRVGTVVQRSVRVEPDRLRGLLFRYILGLRIIL